jgi:hypothetical protein
MVCLNTSFHCIYVFFFFFERVLIYYCWHVGFMAHIGKNIDFLGFLGFFKLLFKIIWNNHNKVQLI